MDQAQPDVAASEKAPVPLAHEGWRPQRGISYIWSIGDRKGWSLFRHCCAIVLSSWTLAQVLGRFVYAVFPGPESLNTFESGWRNIFMAVALMPFAETFLMRMFFVVLRRFSQKPITLSLLSAILWWFLHLPTETWGLHALWLFFVLSLCYLSLEKISAWRAVWVTALMHAACNALSWAASLIVHFLAT